MWSKQGSILTSLIPQRCGIRMSLLSLLAMCSAFLLFTDSAQAQGTTPAPTATPTTAPPTPTHTPTPTPLPEYRLEETTYLIQGISNGNNDEAGLLIIGTYNFGANIFTSADDIPLFPDITVARNGTTLENCGISYSVVNAMGATVTLTGASLGDTSKYNLRPFAHWIPSYNSDDVLVNDSYSMRPPPRNGWGVGAYMILIDSAITKGADLYSEGSLSGLFGGRGWNTNRGIDILVNCNVPNGAFITQNIPANALNWRTNAQSTETIAAWLTYLGDEWNVQLYTDTVTALGADFLNTMLGGEWPKILPGLRIAEGVNISEPRLYTQQCEGGGYDCYGVTRISQWDGLGLSDAASESGIPLAVILLGIFLIFCGGIFYAYQTLMGSSGVRFSAMLMVFLMLPAGIALGMIPTNLGVVVMLIAVLVGLLRTFAQFRS